MAFNLLLRKDLGANVAVAVSDPDRGGPFYFLRPTGRLTFAGTVHAPCVDAGAGTGATGWDDASSDVAPPDDSQVAAFLEVLGRAIPALDLAPADVVRVFWGLLPATRRGSVVLEKRPRIVNHGERGGPAGLFSVSGVKFTTAPGVGTAVLKAAGLARTEPDRARMASLRPEIRPLLAPPEDARELRPLLLRELEQLKQVARDESVTCAEDLVYRRLDWNLADLDLENVVREVADLVPGLHVRTPARRRP
jgi:glycerol-3-phosphate dehydrogenase